MRMCRRLGEAFHGDTDIPVTAIKSFNSTGSGSGVVEPYGTTGAVGAYTGAASSLRYTVTRINFTLRRRTKKLVVSATWNSGYPNAPNYVGLYPGDYPENRGVYYYNDYLVGHGVTIERRSGRQGGTVTTELIPDTPLPAGDYCIYFYARPDGPGQLTGLPAEQVSISAKV